MLYLTCLFSWVNTWLLGWIQIALIREHQEMKIMECTRVLLFLWKNKIISEDEFFQIMDKVNKWYEENQ